MKQEARIVITAQDKASAELAAIQAKFDAMLAPVRRLQDSLAAPIRAVGLDNVANKLGGLKQAMQGVPLAGALFATGGVALATNALLQNSVAAHELLGNLQDLNTKYKVSTEALQVYGEIGKDANVSQESIAKGFSKLQGNIASALGGSKEAIEAFNAVGVNKKDLDGGALQVAKKISELYKNKDFEAADPFKIESAKAIFGKAGLDLIPILEAGQEKYSEVFKQLNAEGRFYNGEQISQADGVGDAWGAAMRKIDGLKTAVGLSMSPMLQAITKSIDDMMNSPVRGEIIQTFEKLGKTIATEAPKFIAQIPSIINGLSAVLEGVNKIGAVVGWDKLVLGGLLFLASPFIASTITMSTALGGLAVSVGITIAKMSALGAVSTAAFFSKALAGVIGLQVGFTQMGLSAGVAWVAALAPVALVIAGIAAVGAAIYFVYQNIEGFKAFFIGAWDGMRQSLAPVAAAFSPITNALGTTFNWLGSLFGATSDGQKSWAKWGDAGRLAGEVIGMAIKGVMTPFAALLDVINLVVASLSYIRGDGFNFKSSLETLWQDTSKAGASGNGGIAPLAQAAFNGGMVKQDIGGRLDVRIKSDGQPVVERMQSNSNNFTIDAMAGNMVGA